LGLAEVEAWAGDGRKTVVGLSSDHAAIGAQRLAVDPAAIRAGEEGDRSGDVVGRAETLQRVHLRHPGNEFVRLAVEEEVAELAVLFGLSENDSNRLRAAAILHDITKELSVDGHLELCKKHSLEVTEDDLKSPKVFHSLTGAYEAMELYPETIDRETFNAIKYHTTGRAGMTLFDKLLYLADYIEKTRSFPDCVKLREYFYSKPASVGHLNKTLLISFDMTLKNLEDEGQFVHPSTLIARNAIAKEIT
jgi:predicted HD superfamily hydrolase involved in NAD metabolism